MSVKNHVSAIGSLDENDDDSIDAAGCQIESLPQHSAGATPSDVHDQLPYMLALARRLTRNPHDAHDLVQDALVRALPALTTIRADSNLRAWLTTIVRHVHIDRLRRVAREPRAVPIDEARVESLGSHDDAADRDDGMDIEDVEAALGALPETFRRVFVLHEVEGRPYREIAVTLNIPLATVGTRLSRAKSKLRAMLVSSHAERALLGHAAKR